MSMLRSSPQVRSNLNWRPRTKPTSAASVFFRLPKRHTFGFGIALIYLNIPSYITEKARKHKKKKCVSNHFGEDPNIGCEIEDLATKNWNSAFPTWKLELETRERWPAYKQGNDEPSKKRRSAESCLPDDQTRIGTGKQISAKVLLPSNAAWKKSW